MNDKEMMEKFFQEAKKKPMNGTWGLFINALEKGFHKKHNQPERLSNLTRKGSDSLNSTGT